MAAAANNKVGIPLETPQPTSRSLNKQGTTTAGDTDAIIDPKRKPAEEDNRIIDDDERNKILSLKFER